MIGQKKRGTTRTHQACSSVGSVHGLRRRHRHRDIVWTRSSQPIEATAFPSMWAETTWSLTREQSPTDDTIKHPTLSQRCLPQGPAIYMLCRGFVSDGTNVCRHCSAVLSISTRTPLSTKCLYSFAFFVDICRRFTVRGVVLSRCPHASRKLGPTVIVPGKTPRRRLT